MYSCLYLISLIFIVYLLYRFGSQHTNADGTNKVNKEVCDKFVSDKTSQTFFCAKDVIKQLRRKEYNFLRSNKVIEIILKKYVCEKKKNDNNINNKTVKEEPLSEVKEEPLDGLSEVKEKPLDGLSEVRVGAVDDTDIIKLRPCEKKQV